jgi:glutamine amidotransferase
MIAIVNYGSGNIQAIANIYGKLGVDFVVAQTPDEIERADKIVLPGVGAFDQAMAELNQSGLKQALDRKVRDEQKPILGICVGMQLLARSSEEGTLAGLGWVDATVRRFVPGEGPGAVRLPHMGWNDVRPQKDNPLFRDVDLGNGYYFLHSYYFVCNRSEDILATTTYGGDFASAVSVGNVHGVQFHPEKSHGAGVALLKNFAQI